jgi:hypothetical protein
LTPLQVDTLKEIDEGHEDAVWHDIAQDDPQRRAWRQEHMFNPKHYMRIVPSSINEQQGRLKDRVMILIFAGIAIGLSISMLGRQRNGS